MRKTLNLYTEDTKTMQAESTVKKVHLIPDLRLETVSK